MLIKKKLKMSSFKFNENMRRFEEEGLCLVGLEADTVYTKY